MVRLEMENRFGVLFKSSYFHHQDDDQHHENHLDHGILLVVFLSDD
jgi:hypothetical protein